MTDRYQSKYFQCGVPRLHEAEASHDPCSLHRSDCKCLQKSSRHLQAGRNALRALLYVQERSISDAVPLLLPQKESGRPDQNMSQLSYSQFSDRSFQCSNRVLQGRFSQKRNKNQPDGFYHRYPGLSGMHPMQLENGITHTESCRGCSRRKPV